MDMVIDILELPAKGRIPIPPTFSGILSAESHCAEIPKRFAQISCIAKGLISQLVGIKPD